MSTKKISNTTKRSYIVEHFVAMNSAIFEMNKAIVDDDAEMFIDAFVNLQWHERSVEVGSQRMMHELDFTESDLQINPLMKYIDQLGETRAGEHIDTASNENGNRSKNTENVMMRQVTEVLMMNENRIKELETGIKDAIEALEHIDCQFFACPGPDKPYKHMATCVRCDAIRHLNELLNKERSK